VQWMAWTWPTAIFWASVAGLLAVMTLLAVFRPETPRMGAFGLLTTRGDRLFLSLLFAAFIHLAWIGLVGLPAWGASAIALGVAAAVFRWV
jgi:predicted small integral membrane protein